MGPATDAARVVPDRGSRTSFSTRYVPGGDVRALLERHARLPLDRALTIIRQVASALDWSHQQRMVHRDVKPDNVLLANWDGADRDRAMLADFGLTYLLGCRDQVQPKGAK